MKAMIGLIGRNPGESFDDPPDFIRIFDQFSQEGNIFFFKTRFEFSQLCYMFI